MKKYIFFILSSINFFIILNLPLPAQSSNPEQALYNLCSRFPLNSQCKGYTPPVSLENRQGVKAKCLMPNAEQAKDCSVLATANKLTVYVEYGKSLSVLGGKPDTKEFVFPMQTISYLGYSETSKINVGAVIALGLWGLLVPEKQSQIRIVTQPLETKVPVADPSVNTVEPQQSTPSAPTDAAANNAAANPEPTSNSQPNPAAPVSNNAGIPPIIQGKSESILVVAPRKEGRRLRLDLEKWSQKQATIESIK